MTDSTPDSSTQKPILKIGWITSSTTQPPSGQVVRVAADRLQAHLASQFPQFNWQSEFASCPIGGATGAAGEIYADPLDLLEAGVSEKIHRRWDFAFVVTEREFVARTRSSTVGVPSSALETAVLSTSRWDGFDQPEDYLAAAANILFWHLLGLDPQMPDELRIPDKALKNPALTSFRESERNIAEQRLEESADQRLEERTQRWNRFCFSVQTFLAEPRAILNDVIGYRPWAQPFRIPALTAAALVSAIFLFLGAESWELGIGFHLYVTILTAILAIGGAAMFLYQGQNMARLTRRVVLSEQLTRSRIVLFSCLIVGMLSLWLLLFGVTLATGYVLPGDVIEGWIDAPLNFQARAQFAAFASSLGTLAGALGGNMENENEFKTRFFFDEEI